uniref:Uncharacterized protein n=1 Tax=Meloidogyne enterolobii TaxID=390850 RepID=A0A6V7TMN6_MELEN|nr:unnamed protein product [Meloidogyne enterolobii]
MPTYCRFGFWNKRLYLSGLYSLYVEHFWPGWILKTLPIFIDHLLSPLLTDAQYLTEVHHVDGSGADSGVVYSEMQDLENDMEIIVDRKRKQLFYPPGSSYAVSTGSRLEELRTQCSASVLGNFTGASTISICLLPSLATLTMMHCFKLWQKWKNQTSIDS